MLTRLWALLTGGTLVWLKDYDGEVTLAIARRDPWGELTANRLWPWGTRIVRLNDDGTAGSDSTCYVRKWRKYNDQDQPAERTK
jgi:hypothetical protein